jgi:hypothetical protein
MRRRLLVTPSKSPTRWGLVPPPPTGPHTIPAHPDLRRSSCRKPPPPPVGGAAHAAVAAWPGRHSASSRILHCPSRQSPSPAREVLCHERRHRHALVHGRSLEPRSAAPRAVRHGRAGGSYFGAHRAVTTAPGPPGPAPLQLGGESELRCIGRLAGEPRASLNWP